MVAQGLFLGEHLGYKIYKKEKKMKAIEEMTDQEIQSFDVGKLQRLQNRGRLDNRTRFGFNVFKGVGHVLGYTLKIVTDPVESFIQGASFVEDCGRGAREGLGTVRLIFDSSKLRSGRKREAALVKKLESLRGSIEHRAENLGEQIGDQFDDQEAVLEGLKS